MLLNKEQESALKDFGFTDWHRGTIFTGRPLRAIVKELVPRDTKHFAFEMIPQMREDLIALNALGIVNWDVREDNYLRGRLVDFSQACVKPHMDLEWDSKIIGSAEVKWCCARDRACFDAMIMGWNEDHPDQVYWRPFMPNLGFGRRLREHSRYYNSPYDREGARFDAAFYDWQNSAKKRNSSVGQRRILPRNATKSRGDGRVRKPPLSSKQQRRRQKVDEKSGMSSSLSTDLQRS